MDYDIGIVRRRRIIPADDCYFGAPLAPVTVTTTNWNPSDKSTFLTLSNGNLTWTMPTNNTYAAVRSVASASTGKKYWEYHIDVISANTGATVEGFANATFPLDGTFLGGDNNGVGYSGTGFVWINGANVAGPFSTSNNGDTVCYALDIGAKKIWFRVNGAGWLNDILANQDPANGIGGISFATLNAGPYFACGQGFATSDAETANFGATAYAQSVPAGFGNW